MSQVEEGTEATEAASNAEPDIDAIVEKFAAQQAEEESQEEAEPEAEAQPEPEAKEETQEAAEKEPEISQEEARWLKQKSDLDKQLREAQQKLKEYENKPAEPESPSVDPQEQKWIREFAKDPAKFLKKHDLDSKAGAFGKMLLASSLGDDIPEDFAKQVGQLTTEARIEALEQEIRDSTDKRSQSQAAAVKQVRVEMLQTDINDLVSSETMKKDFPYISAFANNDSDASREALEQQAVAMIQDGKWPTANKVARALEQKLVDQVSRFKGLLSPGEATDETPEKEAETRKSPKALSDAKQSKKKSQKELRKEQEDWDEHDWHAHAEKFLKQNAGNF